MDPDVDIYRTLPLETLEALDRYLELGILPGGALTAALCDHLAETFARGDERFLANLRVLVRYLFNRTPSVAWGSAEKVEKWLTNAEFRAYALEHSEHREYMALRRQQAEDFVQSCRDNDPAFDGQDG